MRLIETRYLAGGAEFVFDCGDRKASVRAQHGRRPEFPHNHSDLGEPLDGGEQDAALLGRVRSLIAFIDASSAWNSTRPRRRP